MLEKLTNIAEQTATNVSRRGFLRRFGNAARATALICGATLLSSSTAKAGRKGSTQLYLCSYNDGTQICSDRCRAAFRVVTRDERYTAKLVSKTPVETCPT